MPISAGTTPGPRSYVTPLEYALWLDPDSEDPEAPAGVDTRMCARASELIEDHTVTAVYDTDFDGTPQDPNLATALGDATCAQIEFWLTGDEEDDILGPLQGVSAGGVQLQMGAGENRSLPMYLAPRAARILRRAGLMSGAVSS